MKIAIMIIIIIMLVTGLAVLGSLKKKKNSNKKSEYYQKKPLTEAEQKAYWRIKETIDSEKILLSQVAWSSFIRAKGDSKAATSAWYKARQKVADFVICNKDFSIECIIEVDDNTHKKDKDDARDKITEEAGIKTIRIRAANLPTIEELRKLL